MPLESPSALSALDSKLLARVAKGEQQALSQLYDLSSTLLYSMALRILGNSGEAAELLQEIYLDVWKKVSRYDAGHGTPIAWLVTLTRSRAIDRLRTRDTPPKQQKAQPLGVSTTGSITNPHLTPFDAQADQELRGLVKHALASLPQGQQQAIELAYYHGLSHTHLSTALNQPAGTVKTRIKLGMSKLRESLRQQQES